MSADILQFDPKLDAKARFKASRERLGLAAPTAPAPRDSLIMDHADPGDTRPSEMA